MNGDQPSLIGAIIRFFRFKWLRHALAINRGTDKMFTGSARGVADAVDLERDKRVVAYRELEASVSEVAGIVEQDRMSLEALNVEEKDVLDRREGALSSFEAATDAAEKARHKAAFDRFHARIVEIEDEQARLEESLKENEEGLAGYMQTLTDLQAEIEKFPALKARLQANFISTTRMIALRDRIKGIQTSFEKGPLDAVLEQDRKLTAQARVARKLAGTDVKTQDAEYAAKGRGAAASDVMQQMLAARAEKRGVATGAQPVAAKVEDRPAIG